MLSHYDRRRQLLVEGFNRIGLRTFEPNGAFYVFPQITSTGLTSDEFAEQLLREESVAVVPGSAFGQAGEGHVRCCYATSEAELKEAIVRIERFVKRRRERRGPSARRQWQTRYEAVIGIEIHCQLKTASKMFCGCSTDIDGAAPNTHCCPVCLGLPGVLPTINKAAVEWVIATGFAIEADDRRRRLAGIARTTSIRTCPRATRSASTSCRWRPTAG